MKRFIPLFLGAAVAALAGAAQASDLIVNGSFEQPAEGYGYYYPDGLTNSWYYHGVALINKDNGGAWGAPSNVDGQQFAGLQTTGYLYQDFNVSDAGAYTLSWLDAGRGSTAYGDQTYEVLLDGVQLGGTFSTTTGTDFKAESLSLGALSAGGHRLEFLGVDAHGGDNTAFLDGVTLSATPAVSAAPEPATWAMLMLGVFGAGAVLRRSKQPGAVAAA